MITTLKEKLATTPRKVLLLDALAAFARFYMAYIWIKAGIVKIGVHMDVTQTIEAYQIFTPEWSDYLARIIGPLEIAGGLLLLLGIKLKPSGWLSIGVLILFIIGMGQAYLRGLDISCGCFNPAAVEENSVELFKTMARDVFYIALTLFMIYRPFKKLAIWP